MLRLTDARASEPVPLAPAPGRSLRIVVDGGLRELLVADLVRRVATLAYDWSVVVASAGADSRAAAMNIYPSDAGASVDGRPAGLPTLDGQPADGGRPDLVVGGQREGTVSILVAGFSIDADAPDPLALRLALLERHYRERAVIGEAELDAASTTLDHWRHLVSVWARSPGAPMSRPHAQGVVAAFDDDLAIPRALQALGDLVDAETVAPGAKFETFAYVDRLLGLDLARDLGR